MALRFTEERIDSIARKIIDNLDEKDMLRTTAVYRKELYRRVSRIIFQDQQTEIEIEQETLRVLEPLTKKYAPGSPQWEAMYLQAKERIAAKKNFEI
jgi:hypothetical protein